MKKQICCLLTLGLVFSFSVTPKVEAFGLSSIISAVASGASFHHVSSWAEDVKLQMGNIYTGELPSEAYRKEFSVKGTSYLEAVEVGDPMMPKMFRDKYNEHIIAAFNNGASYYLKTQGKKKVLEKTLEIDGFTYEKNKRVNNVADDSGYSQSGIQELNYLYGDSSAYLVDKHDGKKMPFKANYVKMLKSEFIAEVYKFGGEEIEYWYFFNRDDKKLAFMGFNFYDKNHKLKLSKLRQVIVFSKNIPNMSVFDIPKKYQDKRK